MAIISNISSIKISWMLISDGEKINGYDLSLIFLDIFFSRRGSIVGNMTDFLSLLNGISMLFVFSVYVISHFRFLKKCYSTSVYDKVL